MAETQTSLPQTLSDHVDELRSRLKWFALFFALGASIGYAFHQRFIELLKSPLHEKIYYTSPAGGFNFVMKICVVFGLVFALPALVYNVIGFIRPAFRKQISTRTVHAVSALSLILALGGAVFAFLVVVPGSLKFFQQFTDGVQPLLSATDYLSFIINCVISFMVIFQAPLIILFIDRIKPLTPKQLFGYERYVIVGSLAAALILPFTYDPLTQFLIALPIIALYNLSIIFIAFIHFQRTHNTKPVAKQRPASVVRQQPAHQAPNKPVLAPAKHANPSRTPMPVMSATKPKPQHLRQPALAAATRTQTAAPVYRQRQVMDIIPRTRPNSSAQPYLGNASATPNMGV